MTSGPTEKPEDTEKRVLLFAWGDYRPVFLYLGIFGAASLVIHLMGFYLFQVVYPASGRLEPEPSRITLLNESQAEVGALLRTVEDRLVYLRPASAGSEVRVSLGEYSAQFQPSFSERRVNFKPVLPIAAVRGSGPGRMADPLATVTGPPDLYLPPLPAAVDGASPDREAVERRWRISGDLEKRSIRDSEEFSASLPALGTPPAIRISIGVDDDGNLRSFLPVAGQGHPRIGEVIEAVRGNLRFQPKPGAGTEWGWLDISR